LFVVAGTFLGCYAWYWKQHGVSISDEDKTNFIPLVRTTQAAIELQGASDGGEIT